VCLVDHRIPSAVEPQCMDAEGVKTFLPKYLMVASLRAKGKPEAGIRWAVKRAAVPFPGHLMFYVPNMTSADVGSDGTPGSPVFNVDEKTPHAPMIVPVPTGGPGGAGHGHPGH